MRTNTPRRLRVLASHARMAFVQGRQAITSAWGGGVDLVQLVGRSVALRLLCTTEFVDHEMGLAIGLYDRCAGEALAQPLRGHVAILIAWTPA